VNPAMPSKAQIRSATSRPVGVLCYAEVLRRIRLECPDIVLLACTGSVVATLTGQRVFWDPRRPVLGHRPPRNQRASDPSGGDSAVRL
jgi:hypothetical protein